MAGLHVNTFQAIARETDQRGCVDVDVCGRETPQLLHAETRDSWNKRLNHNVIVTSVASKT